MLRELQADFAEAILQGDAPDLTSAIVGGVLAAAARIQVFRNHVLTSLTAALAATYPVVERLVGPGFFAYAADSYIRRHLPTGPCLSEYGGSFAGFLESFPACAGYPYLADVARLEWSMNRALHAEDATAIEPAALASLPADGAAWVTFELDPSAAWLRSPWPVDWIWRANQDGADPAASVNLGAGGVRLEIRRQGEDIVTMRQLGPAEFAFRSALGAGASLGLAADAAATEDSRFDLTEALRALLGEGLMVGVAMTRMKGEVPC
jgi:hypothetical protein